jgi:serine/threonine protein phosphatase PrpC
MKLAYTTRQNLSGTDKPNEDYVLADAEHHLYIICDGVTRTLIDGRYPLPSPAAEASQVFATTAHQMLLDSVGAAPRDRLTRAVTSGNEAVAAYNARRFTHIDYIGSDFGGTVGIIALIEGDLLHYAYIGDCGGYLIRQSTITAFTYPQTAQIAQHYRKHTTLQIRRDIRNNRSHPYCYGVFTGQPTALDCVEYGEFMLRSGDTIALISDGLAPYFDSSPPLPLPSVDEIISAMEQIEREQKLRSDDKTVILVDIE